MALFTEADRDAIKDAIITAISEGGVASVAFGNRSIQKYSLDQLRALLHEAQAEVAGETTTGGLRIRTLVPPGCG